MQISTQHRSSGPSFMRRWVDAWLGRTQRIDTWVLALACVAALLLNLGVTEWLNRSYAASGYPVPYYVAQLSFSAERLQGWYGAMLAGGTLDLYWVAQGVDFVFILSTLVLHFLVLVLVGRAFAVGSRGRWVMVALALLSGVAPMADAAENLVSFAMLADPLGFPAWLAVPYSSLAALKFAFFVLAYLAVPLGLVVALGQRVVPSLRRAA